MMAKATVAITKQQVPAGEASRTCWRHSTPTEARCQIRTEGDRRSKPLRTRTKKSERASRTRTLLLLLLLLPRLIWPINIPLSLSRLISTRPCPYHHQRILLVRSYDNFVAFAAQPQKSQPASFPPALPPAFSQGL